MDQLQTFIIDGIDRDSGLPSALEFDGSDPASAIGFGIRAFGAGQFRLSCNNGRAWQVHVANDHSWWLAPLGHL